MSNDIKSNRSTLKEFLASIATIQGDLSNITAPPFVLGEASTTELPQFWADHPALFVAPALQEDAEQRAVAVLKWFLGSLRNQQYAGRPESAGVKKPLNAFLGELFLGSWKSDELGETRLVSEQVSHHPPVTACYLWNERHGVRAEGFTCQEITFSGSISIKQKGYAILHVDKFDEDYLIPVPDLKVKGVISGTPYPELVGKYSIPSSSGWVSEVKFEGKGLIIGGTKNGVSGRIFHTSRPDEDVFTVDGQWNSSFTIKDARTGKEVETYHVQDAKSERIVVPAIEDMDPWESRKAWSGVIDALGRSDMKGVSDQKSVVEKGQREMRKQEQDSSLEWKAVFFQKHSGDELFDTLSAVDKASFEVDPEGGIWKVDKDALKTAQKPYHGELVPDGSVFRVTGDDGAARKTHSSTEQPQPTERRTVETPSTHAKPTPAVDHDAEAREKLERIQIEELLRAKYSSSNRKR
ncbi:Oxysterol-binding protein [Polyplosphaeria fusca]|uniref:Oxysterol-binding protein n=1 Tax=Polyplosphaeria fusca TaxID=682080 RepID=A0A9P4R1C0_9PLEO|nr:Oxysterol-binding protein [Polyplosphaeria fusca]